MKPNLITLTLAAALLAPGAYAAPHGSSVDELALSGA
jgi:hypothetical protein